jgi:hypothetical protein
MARDSTITRPGFIDLQVNGSYGIDFSDPNTTVSDILDVSRMLRTILPFFRCQCAMGMAGMYLTTATSSLILAVRFCIFCRLFLR